MGEGTFSKIEALAAKAKQEKAEKAKLEAERAAAEKQEKHAERGDVENKLAESTALLEQRTSEITEAEAIVADLGETSGEIVDLLEGLKQEAEEIKASISELTARKEALDAELGSEEETATEDGASTEEAVENASTGNETIMEETATNGTSPEKKELRDSLLEERARIWEERSKLQNKAGKELASIFGTDSFDIKLENADFKGVEMIRSIFEKHQDNIPALQKALREIDVPLLLRLGTLGKIKNWAEGSNLDRIIEIDNRVDELDKQLYN